MRGHRVRIYPTSSQEEYLERIFGHCRFIYNKLLANASDDYKSWKEDKSSIKPNCTTIGLTSRIPSLKKEFDWLKEVPMEALQQKSRDLGTAFGKFFSGECSYPNFKKKGVIDSFRLHDRYFSIKGSGLRLSRFKTNIKVRWDDRGHPHKPTNVTITRDGSGRYFASFLTEYRNDRMSGEGKVGLDMGLTDLVTTSDGEKIRNPKYFVTNQKKLARIQRKLSKKKKGSNNRNKQRLKLAKMYAKIADSRRDYMHKLTTRLINENQVIGIEDLAVNNMMKNRRLSKAIGDASWSMFFRMLVYKAMEAGVTILQVDRFYPSSQTCNICDHQLTGGDKLKLHVRKWTCPKCDSKHDRDINAAKNILKDVLRNKHTPVGLIRVEA